MRCSAWFGLQLLQATLATPGWRRAGRDRVCLWVGGGRERPVHHVNHDCIKHSQAEHLKNRKNVRTGQVRCLNAAMHALQPDGGIGGWGGGVNRSQSSTEVHTHAHARTRARTHARTCSGRDTSSSSAVSTGYLTREIGSNNASTVDSHAAD